MKPVIISAIIAAAATLITTFLPLLINFLRLKKKAKSYVSTGLAVGYYYNFVKPVFEILEVTEIRLDINKKDSNESEGKRKFDSDLVEIEIIIPRELSAPAMQQAQKEAYSKRKGTILRKKDKRNFTINFTMDNDGRLTIIDVPNPLNGVRQYIENLDEFKDVFTESGERINNTQTEKFRQRQKDEIKNFQDAILDFTRREGHASNKIKFKILQ